MHAGKSEATGLAAAPRAKHHWQIGWAFAAGFALLVAIAGYGVLQNRRAAAAREFVAGTLSMHEATLEVERLGTLMEAHQRGFLLAGDTVWLQRRDAAYADGAELLAAMPRQVPDARHRQWVRDATSAFRNRYSRMQAASAAVEREGLDAGRAFFAAANTGPTNEMLSALHALRGEYERLLRRTTELADRQARHLQRVLVYGTAMVLALLLWAATLLYRQLRRNEQLGRALQQAARDQAAKSAELERSNRDLEAFSYSISHDLRAPLRHVDGYARMLQEDAGDSLAPDLRRYLDSISESSRRMGMLIDDLLAFSRLGRKPVERVEVDMNDLVASAMHDAGANAATGRFIVEALPPARADPVLMRQAWVNLISNAVKYSTPKGEQACIRISGEADESGVRYRIRDNGVGFDMRYADKLFGVFQRLHLQDEFEGTGVGLAIVKQVVERHGGSITAEASPGEGACFTVEIPTRGAA